MKSLGKKIARKWSWLKAQPDFQRSPVRITFRLIRWGARCALRRGAIVEIGKWNVRMRLPALWKGVEKLIFVFRENYESELSYLQSILSPGMTFVDVGANLGIYTLAASRIVGPSGRVIAFEPSLQSFAALKQNVALNRLTNVLTIRAALSEKTGEAFLYHGRDAGKNSFGRDPSVQPKGEAVVTRSLDEAIRQLEVETVDVVKMDVEGAEELVLAGAKRVIASHRPIVIFEINPEASGRLGLSPCGAWDFLASSQYDFFVLKQNGLLSSTKAMLMSVDNVVAIPRESQSHPVGDRPLLAQPDAPALKGQDRV